MYHIERGYEFGIQSKRVRLNELKRVARLRVDIDPDHLEARPSVARSRTSGAAEKIQKPWLWVI